MLAPDFAALNPGYLLHECVRQVVARSPDERPQYSIKVSGEAGIGKTHLDYQDVEALAWRID